jgi:hypothetical protein
MKEITSSRHVVYLGVDELVRKRVNRARFDLSTSLRCDVPEEGPKG